MLTATILIIIVSIEIFTTLFLKAISIASKTPPLTALSPSPLQFHHPVVVLPFLVPSCAQRRALTLADAARVWTHTLAAAEGDDGDAALAHGGDGWMSGWMDR